MCDATELRDFILSRSREPEDKSNAPESVSDTFTREDSPLSLDSCNTNYIIGNLVGKVMEFSIHHTKCLLGRYWVFELFSKMDAKWT